MTFHSVTTVNIPSQETVGATDSGNSISGFQYFAVFEPAATTSAAPALDAISMAILIGSLALLGGLALKEAIAARRTDIRDTFRGTYRCWKMNLKTPFFFLVF
jgi:hypothetical protein